MTRTGSISIVCLLYFTLFVSSQTTCNWICPEKSDSWSLASCWSCNQVPDKDTFVVIKGSSQVVLTGDSTALSVHLAGRTLLDARSGSLSIVSNLTIDKEASLHVQDATNFVVKGSETTTIFNFGGIEGPLSLDHITLSNQGTLSLTGNTTITKSTIVTDGVMMLHNSVIRGTGSTIDIRSELQVTDTSSCEVDVIVRNTTVTLHNNTLLYLRMDVSSIQSSWFLSSGAKLALLGGSSHWNENSRVLGHSGAGLSMENHEMHMSSSLVTNVTLSSKNTTFFIQGLTKLSTESSADIQEMVIEGQPGSILKIEHPDSATHVYKNIRLGTNVKLDVHGAVLGTVDLGKLSEISIRDGEIQSLPTFRGEGKIEIRSNLINIYHPISADYNEMYLNGTVVFHLENSTYDAHLSSKGSVMIECSAPPCVQIMLGSSNTSLDKVYDILSANSTNVDSSNVTVSDTNEIWKVTVIAGHISIQIFAEKYHAVPNLTVDIDYDLEMVVFSWNCSGTECAHTNETHFSDGKHTPTVYPTNSSSSIGINMTEYVQCEIYQAQASFIWNSNNYTWHGENATKSWMYVPEPDDPIVSEDGSVGIKWLGSKCYCESQLVSFGYIVRSPEGVSQTNETKFSTKNSGNVTVTAFCTYKTGQTIESDTDTKAPRDHDSLIGENGVMVLMYIIIGISGAVLIGIFGKKIYDVRQGAKAKKQAQLDEEKRSLLSEEHNIQGPDSPKQ